MQRPAEAALGELVALAGLPDTAAAKVSISGDDPVLPTPYRIGAAGAASLAATGLAAAALWHQRTGQRQAVQVDTRAATAALRSSRYMRIDGAAPEREWDPVSGYYPVRGGRWIFLHTNFPNLRDRALDVLGVPCERDRVAEACLGWDGEALETALHAGGACAAFVRSHPEWDGHPHAAAIRALPPFEIVRIGDAPPQPLPPGARPLSGIRVLDLTRVIAGPSCARTLAEHGADVLKITRADLPDSGTLEYDTGIGKLAAHLDLRDPAQMDTLRALVRDGDVFSQSYRPGTLAARGLAPEALARLRPGIVCVTLSAWGHEGPWQARRGYDTVVQSATGLADLSGGGGGARPQHMPVSALDYVSGWLMAFGAMVALHRRATVGGSWLVRASLATTGRWMVDRGLLPAAAFAGVPAELPPDEIAALSEQHQAPMGRVRHLAPAVRMSETPPRWDRPPVPLGTHPAAWPPRPPQEREAWEHEA